MFTDKLPSEQGQVVDPGASEQAAVAAILAQFYDDSTANVAPVIATPVLISTAHQTTPIQENIVSPIQPSVQVLSDQPIEELVTPERHSRFPYKALTAMFLLAIIGTGVTLFYTNVINAKGNSPETQAPVSSPATTLSPAVSPTPTKSEYHNPFALKDDVQTITPDHPFGTYINPFVHEFEEAHMGDKPYVNPFTSQQ